MIDNTLAAFDLDGTLLTRNSSFALCQFLAKKGILSFSDLLFCAVVYGFHRFCGLSLWKLHHLVFNRLFRGRKLDVLVPYMHQFLEENLTQLWYEPALSTLKSFQNKKIPCIILSNAPHFLVEAIGQKIGVSQIFATEYLTNEKNELLALARLMDGREKKRVLENFSLTVKTIAFSDSHLDIPFLEAAHRAVAVRPQRRLKSYAKKRGWDVL